MSWLWLGLVPDRAFHRTILGGNLVMYTSFDRAVPGLPPSSPRIEALGRNRTGPTRASPGWEGRALPCIARLRPCDVHAAFRAFGRAG